MFKIIKKQTRPSTDIPFFFEANPNAAIVGKHMKEKYHDTGKLLSSTREFSEDRLKVVMTIYYRSYDDFKDFISDNFCEKYIFVPNTLYDIEHGITSDTKYITE